MNMNKLFYNTSIMFYNLVLILIYITLFSSENFSQPLALGYDKFIGNVHTGSSTMTGIRLLLKMQVNGRALKVIEMFTAGAELIMLIIMLSKEEFLLSGIL